jgi:hypothetical protein
MKVLADELAGLLTPSVPFDAQEEDSAALAELQRLLNPSISAEQRRNAMILRFREELGPAIADAIWRMQLRVREVQPRTETGSHLAEIATHGWRTTTRSAAPKYPTVSRTATWHTDGMTTTRV